MIEGRVAAVLTRRELVLNVGSDQGVTKGMKFAVLNQNGLSIRDPDTGEELGSVPIEKVLVETVRIQPKLCVARTFRKFRKNVGGSLPSSVLFGPAKYVEEYESLLLEDKPSAEMLDEADSYVKVGDPVRQVINNEYE